MVNVAASAWLQPRGRAGEPVRRPDDDLPRVAVNAVAGCCREISDFGWSIVPKREEERDDVVTGREPGHALADSLHHARAVGHRDTPILGGDAAAGDREIVEVQRARMQPHPDLARSRRAGFADIDQLQPIQSAWPS